MTDEELELANANWEEAKKLLEAASFQLMRFRPFYGTLLASMPVKEATKWLTTAATDGRNLYVNTEFIAGMTPERKKLVIERLESQNLKGEEKKKLKDHIELFYKRKTAREVVFILEHEVRHVVADHVSRGKGYNPYMYNIAADHYINTDLVLSHSKADRMGNAWFPLGDKTQWDENLEFGFISQAYCDFKYLNMYTEEIYEDIVKKQSSPEGEDKGDSLRGVDQHQDQSGGIGGDDDNRASEGRGEVGKGDLCDALGIDQKSQPRLSEEQRCANDSTMRRAIESACQVAGGDAPPEARKFVDEMGKPKINYLRLLKRTIERLFKEDLSYRRVSRRSFSLTKSLRGGGYISKKQTVILPSRAKGKTIRAGLYFDVSGSFNDTLLKPTIREIRGLCNLYEDFEVELACWSTRVGDRETFTRSNIMDISKYKIKTTYGTDVSCLFNYLDEKDTPIDQIVVYTDGVFSDISSTKNWSEKYGNKTLWVILGKNHEWNPPFGKAVIFDKYIK